MDHTIDAVRLALNLQELRARTASANVAGASRADAVAQRYDFAKVETALREAAHAGERHAVRLRRQRRGRMPDLLHR